MVMARLTLTGDLGRLGEERGSVRVMRRTTVGRRVMLRLLLRSRRLVRGKAIEETQHTLMGYTSSVRAEEAFFFFFFF